MNANVSRLGQNNLSGEAKALFLLVFGGEVLSQFDQKTAVLDKHTIRTIESGKSAQFPVTGQGDAEYHTPGTELLGTTVPHSERQIAIDDQLIASRFIASIDEAMNHYDARSIYSHDVARALAVKFDRNVMQVGVLAARGSAVVTGGSAGTVITDADAATNAASFAASLFDMAQNFDEKEVPEDGRYCYVKPAVYYKLAQNVDLINRDWGGSGAYSDGKILKIANFELVKTNGLPSTNVTTGPAAYQGNFSTTVGLCMTREAVGTVKLIDLATEMEWQISKQGWLVLAKYAMGHGILRPECAGEIKSS